MVLQKYFEKDFLAERYVDISEKDLQHLMAYYSDLSEGKTWNSYYWSDLFSSYHRFKTRRTIFKTHRITYYFEDIMHHFKDDVGLYVLRHPVPQALSRMRKGWDPYIDLYSNSLKIRDLIPRAAKLKIEQLSASGSQLERFVLSWCLENYVFIHKMQSGSLPVNVFPVYYEELVINPEPTIRDICSKVNMEFNKDMLSMVNTPSSGIVHSTEETGAQIVAGNKDYLTRRWKDDIDADEVDKVKDILLNFEISVYSDKS